MTFSIPYPVTSRLLAVSVTRQSPTGIIFSLLMTFTIVLVYVRPSYGSPAPADQSRAADDDEIHLRYRIEEEVQRGTVVGSVADDAGLRSRYTTSAMQQIRFRFLADSLSGTGGASASSVPGPAVGSAVGGLPLIPPAGLFEIGSNSGILRTAGSLDRDSPALCRQRRRCELSLDVVVHPIQYFRIIKVVVELIDVNDNSPRFREPQISLSINEAAQPGTLYILPTATDFDSPDVNGVQRYELDSPPSAGDKFSLNVGTKLDGTAEVKLQLRGRLDRETAAEYRLRLVAYDGGSKSGSTTLVINVADSNDNRPEFVNVGHGGAISSSGTSGSVMKYEFTVYENLPIGTVVGQVQAIDRDSGANGLIVYELKSMPTMSAASISGGGQSRYSSSSSLMTTSSNSVPFAVRNTTGEIIVRGQVDREAVSVHRMIVVARDHGPDPLSSEATVIIHVEDLNDNAPTVSVHTLGGGSESSNGSPSSALGIVMAEVAEDSPSGSFVAYVSAVDPDIGPNGRVNCELVFVASGGGGGIADSSSSIGSSPAASFTLVQKYENEYQIVTVGELDRERRHEYTVNVRCRDNGSPSSRIGEKTVRIIVTDINDNPPVFSQQTYRGTLSENNNIGVSVLQVTATDWDSGDNGRIQYSIPGVDGQPFHVDQHGVVSVHAVVDRERHDSYRFPILAVDRGAPPVGRLTGSALIIINIEDVDDERARFVQPHYVFGVHENEPEGTEVGTVYAEDRDGPPFNSFVYAFQSGDPFADQSFSVDPSTGIVSTRVPLDRERRPQFRFLIVAYDPKSSGTPVTVPHSGTATVTVNVLDRNDNTPQFISPPPQSTLQTSGNGNISDNVVTTTVQVSGKAPSGHIITTVLARDGDIDENGRITYSLQRNATGSRPTADGSIVTSQITSGLFRIEPSSGAIIVDGNLVSFSGTVRLVVVATDGGIPPLSTTTAINIYVNHSLPFPATFSGNDDHLLDSVYSSNAGSSSHHYSHNVRMSTFNLVLVVAIVCGCSVVVFLLIVAIAVVRHRDFRRRHDRKYNCRMEALRMITSGSGGSDAAPPPPAADAKVFVVGSPTSGSASPIRRLASTSSATTGFGTEPRVGTPSIPGSKFGVSGGNLSTDSGACTGGDQDSNHSIEGDGSVTDSGRGPSEEGEAAAAAFAASGCSASVAAAANAAGRSGDSRLPATGCQHLRPGTSQERQHYVPPPPPPPRAAAGAYWTMPHHHQLQQQQHPTSALRSQPHHQTTVLHSQHRGPQSHPTVRFHGLSTTIPEEEALGDCTVSDEGSSTISGCEKISNSSTCGRLSEGRQIGRRAASGSGTSILGGGNRSSCVGRLSGPRSSRVYSTSGDDIIDTDSQTLLLGQKSTPSISGSLETVGVITPSSTLPRQSNGHTNIVSGGNTVSTAARIYGDNSVIV